jgi:hypothetical protein
VEVVEGNAKTLTQHFLRKVMKAMLNLGFGDKLQSRLSARNIVD